MSNENEIRELGGKIIDVDVEKEMKQSFLDYSMSVIVSRALPDVRDGLKPVHRRILYTMYERGLEPNKPYHKCADTVGAVLGAYHPHGDASVYDALVRLAQDFSMRYMLVDGHGNFGSVDGDPPAAYRYTEARMSKISTEMLTEIDKKTVDFAPNYDDRLEEPTVLPSRFPNLLVNGSSGIAVGMATNIPPHNLGEVIDAIELLIDNPDAEVADIMECIPGPDFPTGGIIMGRSGIRAAYATGRGKIIVRAKTEIVEAKNNRFKIIVTEIPYAVNKARLIEHIADLVKDKKIEGITNIEESSFMGCSDLVSVRLPESLTTIDRDAFQYCSKLSSINIPSHVKYICEAAFSDCRSLTSVNIPEGVEEIEDGAFYFCNQLTDVALPESLRKIERDAFASCKLLSDIRIPDNVEEISYGAFLACKKLKRITLSEKLKYIGEAAFCYCSDLSTIVCNAKIPPIAIPNPDKTYFYSDVFHDVDKQNCKLYVPQGCEEAYRASDLWKDFNIMEMGTGISEVKSEKYDDAIYDLSGRKVNFQFSTFNSQFRKKGLYIQNGKKVVKM